MVVFPIMVPGVGVVGTKKEIMPVEDPCDYCAAYSWHELYDEGTCIDFIEKGMCGQGYKPDQPGDWQETCALRCPECGIVKRDIPCRTTGGRTEPPETDLLNEADWTCGACGSDMDWEHIRHARYTI